MPLIDLCAGLFSMMVTLVAFALLFLFVGLLIGLSALGLLLLDRVFTRQRLERDAGQLNLSIDPGSPRLVGQREGLGLAVRYINRDKATWYEVTIGGLPKDIGVSREAMLKAFRDPDPEVGDVGFDDRYRLATTEERALAVLTPEVRRGLANAIEHMDDHLHGGVLTVRRRTLNRQTLDDLAKTCRALVEAAEAPRDQQLLAAVRNDPEFGVRVQALRALLRGPPSVASRLAAKKALEGKDPGLRAMAALHLGEGGHAIVREQLQNEPLKLVAWLLRQLSSKDDADLLPEVREAVRTRILPSSHDAEARKAAVEAARFLGEAGTAETAETALIALLEQDHVAITVAAAKGLGRIGTAKAVPTLRAHTKGLLARGDEKRACLAAIARIQERIGGDLSGGLSMASLASEEGALSLAEHEGGELSLLPREPRADEEEADRMPASDTQADKN